ncbi:ArsR family transcriptional regulator [Agromyces protaetiae]|uniref:ArsR family transcriptional regulator n=1 Tax=Agromyces protaetiae TaxID=2509455 RepID=A0A4V0YH75_9MICO|nr:metalloregulator ArsR/SmtB family transcription factor [Agromyces protaetiae]QAY73731.1 ArsR family transcriptional regulator [Agromyces protaetiae]
MEIAESGNKAYVSASASFSALADPVRIRILERLRGADATVSDLAGDLGVSLPSMSKHLNVLQKAGFVTRHVEAQTRRCSLDPDGFARLAEWSRRFESLWMGRLDRLDAVLRAEDEDAGA